MKLALVEWVDSCSDCGWTYLENPLHSSNIITVGLVLLDDTTEIVLAMSRSNTGRVTERMAIPKCCVKRIRYLRIK